MAAVGDPTEICSFMAAENNRPPVKISSLWRIPGGVWALGVVSLLMDVSSEMIHSLLPIFLVAEIGVGVLAVGIIEGIAEAAASMTKALSGALSDRLGRRKPVAVAGYGLAALTRPIFPLAAGAGWVFAARFADRIGKGIRGAPRDALVADLTPAHLRGAAYGLRQGLDTVGALAGPLLAVVLMVVLLGDIRGVFWLAAIPALAAVLVLLVFVRDPPRPARDDESRNPFRRAALRSLGRPFWTTVAVAGLLMLPRFSEAFLILRGAGQALTASFVPLVLVAMNIGYVLTAYPAGALSDRVGRRGLLIAGYGVLALADLVLAAAAAAGPVLSGAVLWGVHMGLTQGILAALVADMAPARWRGTAFGIFHLVAGLAALLASILAGVLWHSFGPAWTFGIGAVVAALCLPVIAIGLPRRS